MGPSQGCAGIAVVSKVHDIIRTAQILAVKKIQAPTEFISHAIHSVNSERSSLFIAKPQTKF